MKATVAQIWEQSDIFKALRSNCGDHVNLQELLFQRAGNATQKPNCPIANR